MGTWFSIHLHPDVESICCPGERSVMSDPVTNDLIDDLSEFFSELIEVIKDPIGITLEHLLLKNVEVIGEDPDSFDVKCWYDGEKLRKHFKTDGEDVLKVWYKAKVDRETFHLQTDEIDKNGELKNTFHTHFHTNEEDKSIKIEIWMFDEQGVRRSGQIVAEYLEQFIVKPLLYCRINQRVKVRSNVWSYDTGGWSALTEPLDEYFTGQQFFDALVDSTKSEAVELKAEVIDKDDTQFTATWDIKQLPLPPGVVNPETGDNTWGFKITKKVNIDLVNLQICIDDHWNDELLSAQCWRVSKDPVRCEFWQFLPNGMRRGGGKEACALRCKLMKLIPVAEITGEIETVLDPQASFQI